mmetsp:Transcript_4441/g.12436  ORF Transcript_4441/g.12436 Transcript_4441/m.12436 type:complete len:586 (-) Transcript_4441:34-1791(-)
MADTDRLSGQSTVGTSSMEVATPAGDQREEFLKTTFRKAQSSGLVAMLSSVGVDSEAVTTPLIKKRGESVTNMDVSLPSTGAGGDIDIRAITLMASNIMVDNKGRMLCGSLLPTGNYSLSTSHYHIEARTCATFFSLIGVPSQLSSSKSARLRSALRAYLDTCPAFPTTARLYQRALMSGCQSVCKNLQASSKKMALAGYFSAMYMIPMKKPQMGLCGVRLGGVAVLVIGLAERRVRVIGGDRAEDLGVFAASEGTVFPRVFWHTTVQVNDVVVVANHLLYESLSDGDGPATKLQEAVDAMHSISVAGVYDVLTEYWQRTTKGGRRGAFIVASANLYQRVFPTGEIYRCLSEANCVPWTWAVHYPTPTVSRVSHDIPDIRDALDCSVLQEDKLEELFRVSSLQRFFLNLGCASVRLEMVLSGDNFQLLVSSRLEEMPGYHFERWTHPISDRTVSLIDTKRSIARGIVKGLGLVTDDDEILNKVLQGVDGFSPWEHTLSIVGTCTQFSFSSLGPVEMAVSGNLQLVQLDYQVIAGKENPVGQYRSIIATSLSVQALRAVRHRLRAYGGIEGEESDLVAFLSNVPVT